MNILARRIADYLWMNLPEVFGGEDHATVHPRLMELTVKALSQSRKLLFVKEYPCMGSHEGGDCIHPAHDPETGRHVYDDWLLQSLAEAKENLNRSHGVQADRPR